MNASFSRRRFVAGAAGAGMAMAAGISRAAEKQPRPGAASGPASPKADARHKIDLVQIREFLAARNLDLYIAMDPMLGHFMTGWMPLEHRDWAVHERALVFVFPRVGEPFIVFRTNFRPEQLPGLQKRVPEISDIYPAPLMLDEKMDVLVEQLRKRAFRGGRIGLEMDLAPALVYRRLQDAFPASEFVDVSAFSRQLMAAKDAEQIACMKHALEATEEGIRAMLREFKRRLAAEASVPRADIVKVYRETLLARAVQPNADEHFANPQGVYKRGQKVGFDLCNRHAGLVSDFCVQVYLGDQAPPELIAKTHTGRQIIDTVVQTLRPRSTAAEAESACDAALKRTFGPRCETERLGDWWQVHGLGIGIHEEPLLGHGNRGACRRPAKEIVRFDLGGVFNVELPGFGEETFVVEPDRIARLGTMRTGVYTL